MRVTQEPTAKVRDLIFVNYRREDARGYAVLLYDRLYEHFRPEQVFMDVNAIPGGVDYDKYIKEKIAESAVVLVVIGQEWLNCSADGRRRLDDPKDFLREEIALALSNKDTLVIPVLVEDTKMPGRDDLPDALKSLSKLQAFPMRDAQFDSDMERLLALLDKWLEDTWWIKLRRIWGLFPVRLLAGLLVLSAVLASQALLAYRPEAVSLEATGKFSPAEVKLGREMLTIEAPSTADEGLLFAHVANANEVVDLGFERARLDGATLKMFSERNPPTRPSRVDFRTTTPGAAALGEPCRTFIQVSAADPLKPPSALHFYQRNDPGGDILRALELKADGDVLVDVDTDMPEESDVRSPGCAKLLKVAPDFAAPVSGISAISLVADAASAARFSFNPATAKQPLWPVPDGLFEPFSFGSGAPAVLRARAVEIVAHGNGAAGPTHVLGARSVAGGEPLSVESLSVGSDRLQVKVSGVGFVKVNGKDLADPLGRVKRYPIPSLLLALADVALLAWLFQLLFVRRPFSIR